MENVNTNPCIFSRFLQALWKNVLKKMTIQIFKMNLKINKTNKCSLCFVKHSSLKSLCFSLRDIGFQFSVCPSMFTPNDHPRSLVGNIVFISTILCPNLKTKQNHGVVWDYRSSCRLVWERWCFPRHRVIDPHDKLDLKRWCRYP